MSGPMFVSVILIYLVQDTENRLWMCVLYITCSLLYSLKDANAKLTFAEGALVEKQKELSETTHFYSFERDVSIFLANNVIYFTTTTNAFVFVYLLY